MKEAWQLFNFYLFIILQPLLYPVAFGLAVTQYHNEIDEMSHLFSQTAGFCAGSVYGDMGVHPDVQVSCEMFKIKVQELYNPNQKQGFHLQYKDYPLVCRLIIVKNVLLIVSLKD